MPSDLRVNFSVAINVRKNDGSDRSMFHKGSFDWNDSFLLNSFVDTFNISQEKQRELIASIDEDTSITEEVAKSISDGTNRNYFEIRMSLACNNDCVHCFIASRPKEAHKSFEEMKELIDASDHTELGLTGGEPTIHPDFVKVIKYAKAKGKRIFVQSHGRTFSDPVFTKMCAPYLDQVQIPIHSVSDHIHDEITKVRGSSDETWKGIENLAKEKVRLVTQTVITRKNYTETDAIGDLIQNRAPGTKMVFTFPQAMGGAASREVVPTYTEVYPYLQRLLSNWARLIHTHYFPPCHLFPYLNEVTCVDLEEYSKSVPGMDILDGEWRRVDYGKYNDSRVKADECSQCIYDGICYGIPKEYQTLLDYPLDLWPVTKEMYAAKVAKDEEIDPETSYETAEETMIGQAICKGPIIDPKKSAEDYVKMMDKTFVLDILSVCNQHCEHCYIAHNERDEFVLPWHKIEKEILLAKEKGFKAISFLGGEPTIHSLFLEAIKLATDVGLFVHVYTNGYKFADEEFLDSCIDAGLKSATISIQSSDRALADKVTKRGSAGENAMTALSHMYRKDLFLLTHTVMTRELAPSLKSTLDEIQRRAPQVRMMVSFTLPQGRAYSLEVTPAHQEIHEDLQKALKAWSKFIITVDIPKCYLYPYHRDGFCKDDGYEVPPYTDYVKPDSCTECSLNNECLGFTKEYAELYDLVNYPK